jgi:membrane protein involved in colicin uptake
MPVAEAKKVLKAQEDARKAAMTEAERLAAEAAEEKTKATTATQAAAQTQHDAAVTIALVRAGVHPDKLEWAARLVGAPVGADAAAITAAIEAAKAAVPEVFAGTSSGPTPPPPGGQPPPPSNPPGTPPPPKPTPDVKAKAAAKIAERFPNLAPKPGGST